MQIQKKNHKKTVSLSIIVVACIKLFFNNQLNTSRALPSKENTDIKNYTVASLTKILILMHGIFTLKTTITCYSVVKNRIGINKNIKLHPLTFLEYIKTFIHIDKK